MLANFKSANPVVKEQGPIGTDESTRVERRSGLVRFVRRAPGIGVIEEPSAILLAPTGVTNLSWEYVGYEDPWTSFSATWTPDPVATSYEIYIDNSGALASQIMNNSVNITIPNWDNNDVIFGIIAVNRVGSAIVYNTIQGCFLAGTPVHMADGSTKAIEEVAIGDMVIGAFGEFNPIIALHHAIVGNSIMYKVNGEHSTTYHHPHVSADKKFYTMEPSVIDNDFYGKSFPVIGPEGITQMKLYGLKKGRVQKLETGHTLKTIDGSRVVETMEAYSMDPATPLFNLVVGGSHTYHADGYAVTGWPREDDFDYELWIKR